MLATLILFAIIGLITTLLIGGVAMIFGAIKLAVGLVSTTVLWVFAAVGTLFLAGWICGLTGRLVGVLEEARCRVVAKVFGSPKPMPHP